MYIIRNKCLIIFIRTEAMESIFNVPANVVIHKVFPSYYCFLLNYRNNILQLLYYQVPLLLFIMRDCKTIKY